MFVCVSVCSISGKAAAVKWLMVPGEAHVTSGRAGPSLRSPPPLLVSLSVSPERDQQCPRDEASVQRATKELNLGTLPGRETLRELREREADREGEGETFGCVNSLSGMKS